MASRMCGFTSLLKKKSTVNSFSSALGPDWLQRTSSCSWENLSMSSQEYDSESLSGTSPSNGEDINTPEGFVAVYVGREQDYKRFLVCTCHLNHPLFKPLLDKAAEEYGYDHEGALTIPCDASLFERFVALLDCEDAPAQIKRLLSSM